MADRDIKNEVRRKYGEIASGKGKTTNRGCSPLKNCCENNSDSTALVDYKKAGEDVVEGSDLGLGCGLPTRYADIREGDVVLDLGSGAGIDVFLAAKKAGKNGRVIGLDMTPAMVELARKNAKKNGYENVEFRLGDIEAMPVENESVSVVISNCVINLAPDKRRVFSEIYRVLKSGGRFLISDIATYGPVPDKVRNDMEKWVGCVAGAMDREEYLKLINEAGFKKVEIKNTVEYDAEKGDGYGLLGLTIEGVKP